MFTCRLSELSKSTNNNELAVVPCTQYSTFFLSSFPSTTASTTDTDRPPLLLTEASAASHTHTHTSTHCLSVSLHSDRRCRLFRFAPSECELIGSSLSSASRRPTLLCILAASESMCWCVPCVAWERSMCAFKEWIYRATVAHVSARTASNEQRIDEYPTHCYYNISIDTWFFSVVGRVQR